jgi:polysaccharide biosynthesis/export protein
MSATRKFVLLSLLSICCSCSSYRQNIMFKPSDGFEISKQMQDVVGAYKISKNDILELDVYTNKGERIVDPALDAEINRSQNQIQRPRYTVLQDGTANFPLIEQVKVEGLSIQEAEALLKTGYSKFYQDPFIKLSYVSKRVVVLGASGGQVIPLTYENMRLTEVLALAKGIGNDAKSNNIRVMRGNEVFIADLSTIAGYQKNNITILPDDIIYIEPVRRPLVEAFRDYSSVFSIITSVTTLIVVIVGLNQ